MKTASAVFAVAKIDRRLWIVRDGERIYTPPDFIVLKSRNELQELAAAFNEAAEAHIGAIVAFETASRKT